MKLFAAPAILMIAVAGCGSGAQTSSIPSGGTGSATTAAASTATSSTAASTATNAQTSSASTPAGCTAVPKPPEKPDGQLKKPALKLNPRRTYIATVKTNCG